MGTVSNPWEKGKFIVGQWGENEVERYQRLFVSAWNCGVGIVELWVCGFVLLEFCGIVLLELRKCVHLWKNLLCLPVYLTRLVVKGVFAMCASK